MWLVVIAVLVAGVGFWFYRARTEEAQKCKLRRRARVKSAPVTSYRGNTIEMCKGACSAVTQMKGKRFLENETPPLPVIGCDNESCTCRYKNFEDRRDPDSDRRNTHGLKSSLHEHSGEQEKRDKNDRRRST